MTDLGFILGMGGWIYGSAKILMKCWILIDKLQGIKAMKCTYCKSESVVKNGFSMTDKQRYKCKLCGR